MRSRRCLLICILALYGLGLFWGYQLEGDNLKLCFADPGRKRPMVFSSSPANKAFLLTCRRKTTDWLAQWLYDK